MNAIILGDVDPKHPKMGERQLERVAHTSFLGFTNPPAARLAAELVKLWPEGTLTRVFFSDDGSTAIEVALHGDVVATITVSVLGEH